MDKMDIKVKKIITIADTPYLKIYNAEYTNKFGATKNWSIASRKPLKDMNKIFFEGEEGKIDAVIIVATHIDEEKLVVIKQFRIPLNDYVYEVPAGLIDAGEDFETTVRRELKEETGLDLVEIDYKKTKAKAYISTGMTDESVALVYCTCRGVATTDNLEDDEDIEVMLVSKEEAKKITTSKEKIDIKALLVMQNFINS